MTYPTVKTSKWGIYRPRERFVLWTEKEWGRRVWDALMALTYSSGLQIAEVLNCVKHFNDRWKREGEPCRP